MSMLKGIIKYFSKSGLSTALLRKERNLAKEDEPIKALQKIGKTCFRTHWTAANSLDPCLPHMWNLVISQKFLIKYYEYSFYYPFTITNQLRTNAHT